MKRSGVVTVPAAYSGAAPRGLQFSDDGSTLYYVFGDSGVTLISAPVTASGLGAAVMRSSKPPASSTSLPARYFAGRIYTTTGAVFDAATMVQLGAVPVLSKTIPLLSSSSWIVLASGESTCSLQAYDPITLLPLWEEDTSPACDASLYPGASLFDIGEGRVAFRMAKAYIVKEPAQAPQLSITPVNSQFQAALELGAAYSPR